MTQQLKFEEKWDKTLSEEDRKLIERIHNHIVPSKLETVNYHVFRVARNHRHDLLVSTLVENHSSQPLVFTDKSLNYVEEDKCIASHRFTLSQFSVPPFTNSPWTFIFPDTKQHLNATLKNGHLEAVQ